MELRWNRSVKRGGASAPAMRCRFLQCGDFHEPVDQHHIVTDYSSRRNWATPIYNSIFKQLRAFFRRGCIASIHLKNYRSRSWLWNNTNPSSSLQTASRPKLAAKRIVVAVRALRDVLYLNIAGLWQSSWLYRAQGGSPQTLFMSQTTNIPFSCWKW